MQLSVGLRTGHARIPTIFRRGPAPARWRGGCEVYAYDGIKHAKTARSNSASSLQWTRLPPLSLVTLICQCHEPGAPNTGYPETIAPARSLEDRPRAAPVLLPKRVDSILMKCVE